MYSSCTAYMNFIHDAARKGNTPEHLVQLLSLHGGVVEYSTDQLSLLLIVRLYRELCCENHLSPIHPRHFPHTLCPKGLHYHLCFCPSVIQQKIQKHPHTDYQAVQQLLSQAVTLLESLLPSSICLNLYLC